MTIGGRRECRVLAATHGPRAAKKHGEGTTGSAESSGIPCAMALQLIRTLPGDRAFLPPSLAAFVTPANLASASGGQDHTISPSAAAPFVRAINRARRSRGHRIPASRFVTIAHTPLQTEAGCAHQTTDLGSRSSCFTKIRIRILRQTGTTGSLRMALMRKLPAGHPPSVAERFVRIVRET